jgi:hypothetical protein
MTAAPAASSVPKPAFMSLDSFVDIAGNPDRASVAMAALSEAPALKPVNES